MDKTMKVYVVKQFFSKTKFFHAVVKICKQTCTLSELKWLHTE